MFVFNTMRAVLCLAALLLTAACATAPGGPAPGSQSDVVSLSRGIQSLGSGIDPEEAARLARVAYAETYTLAQQYEIEDGPIIHNMKVNQGLKPRGLCRHWAEDMERRLLQEGFETITVHRAIANADNPFRLEHSTVIVSQRGDSMYEGMVLDPWREGGTLFWSTTATDEKYDWVPRMQVLAQKRDRLLNSSFALRAE